MAHVEEFNALSRTSAANGDGSVLLFVDDERQILDAARRAIRKEPYHILTAQSAEEALKILQTTAVDAIICDEQMPKMPGSELLSTIRAKYPRIIRFMLSGKADLRTVIEALDEGEINRFFIKPCNWKKLGVAVREALIERDQVTGLKVHDCVTYSGHGLGIYRGIKHLNVQGRNREFLCIDYGENTFVYVPVDQRERIERSSIAQVKQ